MRRYRSGPFSRAACHPGRAVAQVDWCGCPPGSGEAWCSAHGPPSENATPECVDPLSRDDLLDECRLSSKEVVCLFNRFSAVGEDSDDLSPLDENVISFALEQLVQVVPVGR